MVVLKHRGEDEPAAALVARLVNVGDFVAQVLTRVVIEGVCGAVEDDQFEGITLASGDLIAVEDGVVNALGVRGGDFLLDAHEIIRQRQGFVIVFDAVDNAVRTRTLSTSEFGGGEIFPASVHARL
jgi:hypothetical protein